MSSSSSSDSTTTLRRAAARLEGLVGDTVDILASNMFVYISESLDFRDCRDLKGLK
jgi:hypothetical protein